MTLVILLMLLGLVPAFIAHSKGRSMFLWWLYGAVLFLIALPHALLVNPLDAEPDQERPLRRPCPHCAEDIHQAARVCPFCKIAVEAQQTCPRCHASADAQAEGCPACGQRLAG